MSRQLLEGPDGSFGPVVARNSRYRVRIPTGSDVCHRGCAYTVLQTVQMPVVCSAVYDTVHYKEPLKSFDKCLDFRLLSVAILQLMLGQGRQCFTMKRFISSQYVYDIKSDSYFSVNW